MPPIKDGKVSPLREETLLSVREDIRHSDWRHRCQPYCQITLRESKKLVPFSLFLLKCWCTGRFTTGVVAPTSPILLPLSTSQEKYGRCSANYSRALRPLFIRVWATWREKGTSFIDFLKNSPESVTDWPLLCYRLTVVLLPTDHCFVTGWSLFSYRLKPIIGSVKASIW